MKLVERITSNPFIFAFFMLVALVLGGVLIGAFILVFGMGRRVSSRDSQVSTS